VTSGPGSEPRRLLLVSHHSLEAGGVGATRWRFFDQAFPALGWQVRVVSAPAGVTTDPLSADPRVARASAMRARVMGRVGAVARPVSTRVLRFQPEAFPPSVLWSFRGRSAIKQAVAEWQPHAVVATTPPPAALFAIAGALRGSGIPLVADLRDPWAGSPFYDAGGKTLTRIEGRALSDMQAIVAVTTPMLAQLSERHPSLSARMHMLPNGFAPDLIAMRPATKQLDGGPLRLIHPGALYGERTMAPVIDALAGSPLRERVQIELLGSVNPSTEDAMRRAPDVQVKVSPPAPWPETVERIAAADGVIVLFPNSIGDQIAWPVKMFEGLALGRRILHVSDGGAGEQLLRELGQTDGIARLDDRASIQAAIERLLANEFQPVSPERLAPWDRSNVARDYVELLNALVAREIPPSTSAISGTTDSAR
jgi:hypothetical protein